MTYTGLCQLTRRYVEHHGIANSLCAKLRAAHAAALRGNTYARAGQLGAYGREVSAQSGKAMTAAEAAELTHYANVLLAEPVAVTAAKAKAKKVVPGTPGNKRGFVTKGGQAD